MPDILEQLAKEYAASQKPAKPARSKEGHNLTTPFQQGLASDLESRGFTVTSATRPQDRGSRHSVGAALDIRTKDQPTEVVDILKAELEQKGLRVLDERYVKTKNRTGPHLHVSTDDPVRKELQRQAEQRQPQPPKPLGDVFASLADEYEKKLAKPQAPPATAPTVTQSRSQFDQLIGKQPSLTGQLAAQVQQAKPGQGITVRQPDGSVARPQAPPQKPGMVGQAARALLNLSPVGMAAKLAGRDYGSAVVEGASELGQQAQDIASRDSNWSQLPYEAAKTFRKGVRSLPQAGATLLDAGMKLSPGMAILRKVTGVEPEPVAEQLQNWTQSQAAETDRIYQEKYGIDPQAKPTISSLIGSGFGSSLLLAGGGAALGGVKGVAAIGAAMNAQQVYEEARQKGATPQQAANAATIAAPIGALEGLLGVEGQLARVGVSGMIAQKFTQALKSIPKEASQEITTEVLNNINAAKLSGYDKDRSVLDNVVEAAIGSLGLSGATVGGSAARGITQATRGALSQPSLDLQPAITEALTGQQAPASVAADAVPPRATVPTQVVSNADLMAARNRVPAQTAQPSGIPAQPVTATPEEEAETPTSARMQSIFGAVLDKGKKPKITPEEKVAAEFAKGMEGFEAAVSLYEEAEQKGNPEAVKQSGKALVGVMKSHLRKFGTQMDFETEYEPIANTIKALEDKLGAKPVTAKPSTAQPATPATTQPIIPAAQRPQPPAPAAPVAQPAQAAPVAESSYAQPIGETNVPETRQSDTPAEVRREQISVQDAGRVPREPQEGDGRAEGSLAPGVPAQESVAPATNVLKYGDVKVGDRVYDQDSQSYGTVTKVNRTQVGLNLDKDGRTIATASSYSRIGRMRPAEWDAANKSAQEETRYNEQAENITAPADTPEQTPPQEASQGDTSVQRSQPESGAQRRIAEANVRYSARVAEQEAELRAAGATAKKLETSGKFGKLKSLALKHGAGGVAGAPALREVLGLPVETSADDTLRVLVTEKAGRERPSDMSPEDWQTFSESLPDTQADLKQRVSTLIATSEQYSRKTDALAANDEFITQVDELSVLMENPRSGNQARKAKEIQQWVRTKEQQAKARAERTGEAIPDEWVALPDNLLDISLQWIKNYAQESLNSRTAKTDDQIVNRGLVNEATEPGGTAQGIAPGTAIESEEGAASAPNRAERTEQSRAIREPAPDEQGEQQVTDPETEMQLEIARARASSLTIAFPRVALNGKINVTYEGKSGKKITRKVSAKERQTELQRKYENLQAILKCLNGKN